MGRLVCALQWCRHKQGRQGRAGRSGAGQGRARQGRHEIIWHLLPFITSVNADSMLLQAL